ncbi:MULTISPECIES: ATP-binding protein [unclassified Streptomyces]|uniref:ATP-binding protein n=1 Tax=unclassified Streptomyces TaxID=2593676 RepID=UPI002E127E56|nr:MULTISPECIES: ATP-binding protein [unclassified Streptomyces]WSR27298.1 ATP-binding protein [Streptomyces sp. NBC_01205]
MGTNGSTMLEPLRQGLPPVDPTAVSGSASCALPSRFEAVRGARSFTRSTLSQWDLDERFDDVALVVSELVTNALRHALPDDARPGSGGAGEPEASVRLHLMRWSTRLVCAVRDPSEDRPGGSFAPERTQENCDLESGRGLFLVDAYSDNWGWHPLAGRLTGKVVWALFMLHE